MYLHKDTVSSRPGETGAVILKVQVSGRSAKLTSSEVVKTLSRSLLGKEPKDRVSPAPGTNDNA